MPKLYIDADACPVKEEVYRVAQRYGLNVIVVANSWMRTPDREAIHLEVVGDGFDEADDWIVNAVQPGDIVITGDIPLAARCLEVDAKVLGLKGREFTEESIGTALANREFLAQMREHGLMEGGPAAFTAKDRSLFLQQLDVMIQAGIRNR